MPKAAAGIAANPRNWERLKGLVAAMPAAKRVALEQLINIGAVTGGEAGAAMAPPGQEELYRVGTQLVGSFGMSMTLAALAQGGRLVSPITKGRAPQVVARDMAESLRGPAGQRLDESLRVATAVPGGGTPTLTQAIGDTPTSRRVAAAAAKAPGAEARMLEQEAQAEATGVGLVRQTRADLVPGEGTITDAVDEAKAALAAQLQAIEQDAALARGDLTARVAAARQDAVQAIAATQAGIAADPQARGRIILRPLLARRAELDAASAENFAKVTAAGDPSLPAQEVGDTLTQLVASNTEDIAGDAIPPVLKTLGERLAVYAESAGEGGPLIVPFSALLRWRQSLSSVLRDLYRSPQGNERAERSVEIMKSVIDKTLDQMGTLGNEAATLYRAAAAEHFKLMNDFTRGTVGEMLKGGPVVRFAADGSVDMAASLKTPLEDAATKVLAKGAITEVQDYTRAVGSTTQAEQSLRDAALGQFLKATVGDDGVLNRKRAAAWVAQRREQLAAFPGITAAMDDLVRRARTLDDVEAALPGSLAAIEATRKATIGDLEQSAAAAFAGRDPAVAIDQFFTGSSPAQDMRQVMGRIKQDARAANGMRGALVDRLFAQGGGDGTPTGLVKNPDAAIAWLAEPKHTEVFRAAEFSPADLKLLKERLEVMSLYRRPSSAVASSKVEPSVGYVEQQFAGRLFRAGMAGAAVEGAQAIAGKPVDLQAAAITGAGYFLAEAAAMKINRFFRGMSDRNLAVLYERASFDPVFARDFAELARPGAKFDPESLAQRVTRHVISLREQNFRTARVRGHLLTVPSTINQMEQQEEPATR